MEKILSIIVPVYNAEQFLNQCVESIVSALRPGMDVILVNDGSADRSGEICDQVEEKYDNIKVIHKENGGVTSARKAGLLASEAEFITFVDSDDWVEPDMYEKMLEKAQKYGADVVVSSILREEESGQTVLKSNVKSGFYDRKCLKEQIFPIMLYDFRIGVSGVAPSLCNKLFRRSIIEKVMCSVDLSISYGEDAMCTFPCLLEAESAYFMDEGFYHYRQNFLSVTCVYDNKMIQKCLVLHDVLKKYFEERNYYDDKQLQGYVASTFLFFVRKEFLYNKELNVKNRIETVREYIKNPLVESALRLAYENIFDDNVRLKIRMMLEGKLRLLFLLFFVKEKIRRLKGEQYDN